MLIGEYKHTIDTKKRVALPSNFRQELGKKVVLAKGLDNCLSLYPLSSWKKVAEKLQNLSFGQSDTRSFNRFMLSSAVETAVDTMGRILIPDFLKEFAGLKTKVVIAGISDRVEIWDETKWKTYTAGIEKQADALAQKLGEVGVI